MSRQRIEIEPMNKKNMIRLVLAVLLVSVSIAEGQQPKKVSRIGYFSAFSPTLESLRSDAIRHALRELGYIDGQNIVIEYRYMQGKLDRAPELIADLGAQG
jgi:putative ABC transport system substrate-binding protein